MYLSITITEQKNNFYIIITGYSKFWCADVQPSLIAILREDKYLQELAHNSI